MRRGILLVLVPILFFCGCARSEKTDTVLFCKEFNQRSQTVQITEADVMRRSADEMLVAADDVLLRLQTDADAAVQNCILTAQTKDAAQLMQTAQIAFSVLASPLGEDVPESFLAQIMENSDQIQKTETEYFRYLLYGTQQAITVQQLSLLPVSQSDPPSLRPTEPD